MPSRYPGMAAAVVGSEGILWERGLGKPNLERSDFTQTFTPFQLDGLTEVFTSTLILQCVDQSRLSLDVRWAVRIRRRRMPSNPSILTHTSGPADDLVYAYAPTGWRRSRR